MAKSNNKKALSAVQQSAKVEAAEEKVKGLSVAAVLADCANIKVRVVGKLDEVVAAVQSRMAEYEAVDTSIAAKKIELKRLLGLEGEAVELDEAISALRLQLEELEAAKEASLSSRAQAEAEAEQLRVRKSSEWDYAEAKRQRDIKDRFDQAQAAAVLAEKNRKEDLERTIAIRTEDLDRLNKDLDVQARIQDAVAVAVAQTRTEAADAARKTRATYEDERSALIRERDLAKLGEAAITKVLAERDKDLAAARAQLEKVNAQIAEIAGRAIDGARVEKVVAQELTQAIAAAAATPPAKRLSAQ